MNDLRNSHEKCQHREEGDRTKGEAGRGVAQMMN